MYAAPATPFRHPIPIKRKPQRRQEPSPPGLLDNAPTFADMAELDAWVKSCKIPSPRRRPGLLTEAEWANRGDDDDSPDVLADTWQQAKGIYRPTT